MADKIRMVYEPMNQMATTFDTSAKQLEATLAMLASIANTMEQGALLGSTGEIISAAVRQDLTGSVTRLMNKFIEEAADIRKNIEAMKQAEGIASNIQY
jgi:uncharacterized protein YukE